jgi:hypothetical protein
MGERLLRTLIATCRDLGIHRWAGSDGPQRGGPRLVSQVRVRGGRVRRQAYRLDEGYVDEISMGLLLPLDRP